LWQLGSDWWLAEWSTAYVDRDAEQLQAEKDAADLKAAPETVQPVDVSFYLGVYFLLVVAACATVTSRSGLVAIGVIRAAVKMHDGMLNCVMRAPTKFFDTTPSTLLPKVACRPFLRLALRTPIHRDRHHYNT